MREIKFRFRYTDGAHWIFKAFTMQEMLNGDPFEVLSDSPLLRGYKLDGWDQYTGRKDEAGKDVYGGDICSGEWPYAKKCTVEWDDKAKNKPPDLTAGEFNRGE